MKYLLTIAILYSTIITVSAQQDPSHTFYRYNMNLINPAYAGAGQGIEFGLGIRSQWANVKGAPETQSLFFGIPMGKNVGIGLSIINDKTFVENQTSVALDFSYKLKINADTSLFLGLKATINSYSVNTNGLITYDIQSDPNLMGLSGRFTPNIGAGAYLRGKSFFVSLSVPKILGEDRLGNDNGKVGLNEQKLHVYSTIGYDFRINRSMVLKPSVLARYLTSAPFDVDLTMALAIGERFEIGSAYRFRERFSGFFIFKISPITSFGYAYESALEKVVAKSANGSHELFLKITL